MSLTFNQAIKFITVYIIYLTNIYLQHHQFLYRNTEYHILFLKETMNNGYYVMSAAESVKKSVADKNWAAIYIKPAQLCASDNIANLPFRP
jgi:hypothetical protein